MTEDKSEELSRLYPYVDESATPLPRSWSTRDKFTFIGLSQRNLRVHYKGMSRLSSLTRRPELSYDDMKCFNAAPSLHLVSLSIYDVKSPVSLFLAPVSSASVLTDRFVRSGAGKNHRDAASVRTSQPIPAACGLYYFEITVVSKGRDG